MTDAARREIVKRTNLLYLNLGGTQFTDAGLQHIDNLPRLEFLYLSAQNPEGVSGTQVTDEGRNKIVKLPNLWSLDLCATGITDAGLKGLAKLRKLATLNLTAR